MLAYPLLFFVVTELRLKGLSFFAGGLDVAAAALLLATYVIAWAVDRRLRRRGETWHDAHPTPAGCAPRELQRGSAICPARFPPDAAGGLGDENERVALSPSPSA